MSRFRSYCSRLPEIFAAALCIGLLATPALAQFDLEIVSYSYDQHHHPTDTIRFDVTVRNNESTAQFAEVDITLTNIDTEVESTLTPVLTATIPAGETRVLTDSYVVAAGNYTVTFPLYDGNGDVSDRLSGEYPLHIGTETESLRVFPEALNLGTLPPGRFMHPTPIEIRWSFYRFNRIRTDQPFVVRIYTDNAARFHGVRDALHRLSPAGLVSLDGRFFIPMKLWMLNYGPDIQDTGWDGQLAGPPSVDDDDYWIGPELLEDRRSVMTASWVRLPDLVDMTGDPVSWRRLIGQDSTDSRFVADANVTGDFTLNSPFTVYMATDAGATAVEGSYSANLIVELWNP